MDEVDDLKKKAAFFREFIADLRKRGEQLPYVLQSLELTNHQLEVAASFPDSLSNMEKARLLEAYSSANPFWQQFAGFSPSQRNPLSAASGFALEASGSNVANQSLVSISITGSDPQRAWAQKQIANYQEIENKQHRADQVQLLISRLFPGRVEEFTRSSTSFASAVSGSQAQSTWGISARNLLEHVKGDLFLVSQKAHTKQKVNKRAKWTEFANALARGGVGSPEHRGLLSEEATHIHIHGILTDVAKNRIQPEERDLRSYRTELHDHLFTVLSLVDDSIIKLHS